MSNEPDVTTVCPKCMSVNVQRLGLLNPQTEQISAPISGRCLDCGEIYETDYGREVLNPNEIEEEPESEIEKLSCADCESEKFDIQIRGNEFRAICCGCNQVVLEVTIPETEVQK